MLVTLNGVCKGFLDETVLKNINMAISLSPSSKEAHSGRPLQP